MIVAFMCLSVVFVLPSTVFGATAEKTDTMAVATMKEELENNGFSGKELEKMVCEIPELYEIVTNNDLSDE